MKVEFAIHCGQGGNISAMTRVKSLYRIIITAILLAGALLTTSCSQKGSGVNPADWHYDCIVIYDSLGGSINSRETRETYYIKNSYIFKPAGTTNMLIEPVKDGYILAGWYTAKEDIVDETGKVVGYSFKAEDRWDFDEDRVQGNMTIYARWVPQGKIQYIDGSTGDVMFSKNITADSPVQKLSAAAETLVEKDGYTLYGYFSDKACALPYDFTKYTHEELIPTNADIYARLYDEFPAYFKKAEFVESSDDEEKQNIDTSDLFINKLGYEIFADEEARLKIRARKDEIIENAILNYEKNTADKVVYLKYEKGNHIRIADADDLKIAGKYRFAGADAMGATIDGYIILNDIDFKGAAFEMAESFSGKIYGNGFRLKNIEIKVVSKKLDEDTSKSAGLFKSLDGAHIENIIFENMTINLNVNAGIPVTVGALAVQATDTTLKNVRFDTLSINTGKGDNGTAKYKIYDLFAGQKSNLIENVTGNDIKISASDFAQIESVFLPEEQEP